MNEEQELALLISQLSEQEQAECAICYFALTEVLSRYTESIAMLALARIGIERMQ